MHRRASLSVIFELEHLTNSLANYIEQRSSSEANRFSASQEISRIVRNPEVSLPRIQEPATLHILSQINPIHASHSTS